MSCNNLFVFYEILILLRICIICTIYYAYLLDVYCIYICHNMLYRLNHGDTMVYKVSEVVFRVNISLLPFPENSGGRIILYIILLYVYKTLRRPHQTRINRFVKRKFCRRNKNPKTVGNTTTTASYMYIHIMVSCISVVIFPN